MRRLARVFLRRTTVLSLVAGLSLLLSYAQVLAQPTAQMGGLEVEKEVSVDVAAPGDMLVYTIVLNNSTADDIAAQLTNPLHPLLEYMAGSAQAIPGDRGTLSDVDGIAWTGTVSGTTAITLTFQARVSDSASDGSVITDTVTVNDGVSLIERSVSVTVTVPPVEPVVSDTVADPPPTSQIRFPDRDAVIMEKGSLTISGYAWDEAVEPPFLTGDVFLTINRTSETAYLLRWTPVISASYYLVEEATDPQFNNTQSVYYGSNTEYPHTQNVHGTYYYRVRASASDVPEPSRWSNVESVVVPWVAGSTVLSTSGVPVNLAANGPITVQVSIAGGEWHNAVVTSTDWNGWEWSYVWDLPEEDDVQYTIQARASDVDGDLGPTDTITVTLRNQVYTMVMPLFFKRWPPIPYPPTLNDISNPDADGDYTVSWSYQDNNDNVPDPTSYTLQEATDASFTSPTSYDVGSSTSKTFEDKDSGTYYYRVRGHNTWGPGEWSAVKSTTVRQLRFDFNSPTKIMDVWPIRRTSYWRGDIKRATWTEEHDGNLYIIMDDKWDFAIASPWEQAPDPPYVIEARVKVRDPANLVAYGIIFGGNDGSPCPAYRDTGCLSHYYRLEAIWYGKDLKAGLKRIDYHEPESSEDRGKGRGKELIGYSSVPGGGDSWHTWKIKVNTDGIEIYVDGAYWGSTGDTRYINDPYFGVYASADEYKPAIGQFDYYYVEPK